MNYNCVICYERCRKPIRCNQCRQILCSEHLKDIRMVCPNCRSDPFQFQRDLILDTEIDRLIKHEREEQKDYKIYHCLVEGCTFQGKYHSMEKHRRRFHYFEKLSEILYAQQRLKKNERNAFRKLITYKLQSITDQHNLKAFFIYLQNSGQCNLYILLKMVEHIEKCTNPQCKQIYVEDNKPFIGDPQRMPTQCHRGKLLAALR